MPSRKSLWKISPKSNFKEFTSKLTSFQSSNIKISFSSLTPNKLPETFILYLSIANIQIWPVTFESTTKANSLKNKLRKSWFKLKMPLWLCVSTRSFIETSNFLIFWLRMISKSRLLILDLLSLWMRISTLTLGSELLWRWLLKFFSKNSTIKNAISGVWGSLFMKCYSAKTLSFCTRKTTTWEWDSRILKSWSNRKFGFLFQFQMPPKTWSKKCWSEIPQRGVPSSNFSIILGFMMKMTLTWIKFYWSKLSKYK